MTLEEVLPVLVTAGLVAVFDVVFKDSVGVGGAITEVHLVKPKKSVLHDSVKGTVDEDVGGGDGSIVISIVVTNLDLEDVDDVDGVDGVENVVDVGTPVERGTLVLYPLVDDAIAELEVLSVSTGGGG
jgi:hypothetical protein